MAKQRKEKHDYELEAAAAMLLDRVKALDGVWADLANMAMTENGWGAYEFLGACVGYVLDNQLQMVVPKHPAFQPNYVPMTDAGECMKCGRDFKPDWAGQRMCPACVPLPVYERPEPPIDTRPAPDNTFEPDELRGFEGDVAQMPAVGDGK